MKRATGIFKRMAAAALACGLACGAVAAVRGQSAEPAFEPAIRIFVGQQAVRLVENATSARVLDASLATVVPDGDARVLLTGLKPGRTVLAHARKDGTPVAEPVVVMPPLSANALEIYGLVADIPGIRVYEVQERTVVDGRLASGSDVDRVKAIADAMGESVLNLTVLDTGASNDVITDFIRRNAGVDGLTVSIFGDTAYLRGTVASEAVRSNVVALAATQIANVMDMLTVQTGMIETEVLFLRVEKSKGKDWGMNVFGGSTDVLGLNAGLSGSQNYAENVWSTPQIAVSWSASLAPAINALVSGGQAEVVARPRIGTRIGETGRFLSGGEMFYKTAGEISGDLDSVEYGIELAVAPQWLLDRQLCNNIKINLSYPVAQSSGADLSLDKYTIESTVVCEAGQSIVVSGLTEHIHNAQDERTPLLGRIPVLRLFFSHRQRSTKDSELVAIITPRVLERGLNEEREAGVSESVRAERAKLEARDAEAAERAQEEHVLAQRMVAAGVAQAEADGAKAERRALEEEIKAKREAEKEREKTEKLQAKEREREARRLEKEKAGRRAAAEKRKAKREAEKAAEAEAEERERQALEKAREEEERRAAEAEVKAQREAEKAAKAAEKERLKQERLAAEEEAKKQREAEKAAKAAEKERLKQERLAAEEEAKAQREAEKAAKAAEKERLEQERLAAEAEAKAQREAEKARKLEEKRQEKERKAEEKLREKERKEAEKRLEQERKQEEAARRAAAEEAKARQGARKVQMDTEDILAHELALVERKEAELAKQAEEAQKAEEAAQAKQAEKAAKAAEKERLKQERLAAAAEAKAQREAEKARKLEEKQREKERKAEEKRQEKERKEAEKRLEQERKQEEAARQGTRKVQMDTEDILAHELALVEREEAELAKQAEEAQKAEEAAPAKQAKKAAKAKKAATAGKAKKAEKAKE